MNFLLNLEFYKNIIYILHEIDLSVKCSFQHINPVPYNIIPVNSQSFLLFWHRLVESACLVNSKMSICPILWCNIRGSFVQTCLRVGQFYQIFMIFSSQFTLTKHFQENQRGTKILDPDHA